MYKKILNKEFNFAFCWTFISSLLVHGFMFLNKITNHDDIHQLYNVMDLRISGRWFLQFASGISTPLSMPWVNGLLITLYLSICVGLIVRLFSLTDKKIIVFLSLLFVSFPPLTAVIVYMNSADGYIFAMLLSVIGSVFYLKGGMFGKILFILLNVLSLATYQIYLGLSISIILVYYFFQTLNQDSIKLKRYASDVFYLGVFSAISLIMYYFSVKYIFVVELTSYQGISEMGNITFSTIISGISKSYLETIKFFVLDSFLQFKYIKFLNIILLVITIYYIVKIVNNKKGSKIIKLTFVGSTLIILPLVINLLYILIGGSYAGLRMLYCYIVYYLFLLVLIDRYPILKPSNTQKNIKNLSKALIYTVLFITIFKFFIYDNTVYFSLYLDQKNLESYTTRLITRIEEKDFYEEYKTIYFIGTPDLRNDFNNQFSTPDILKTTLLRKKISGNVHYRLYPSRYLAFNNMIRIIDNSESIKLLDNNVKNKVKNSIGVYPKDGSIFEYNNEIYVNFGGLDN